jgi:hypothetical protein
MKKTSLFLVLPFLFFLPSCSTKTTSTEPFPTQAEPTAGTKAEVAEDQLKVSADDPTSIYIGFISHFADTKEFYVGLSFLDPTVDSEELRAMADSLVMKNDVVQRDAFPMKMAKGYFRLSGLDELNVYNDDHKHIGAVRLKRIEYFSAEIEAQFIAVFDAKHLDVSDDLLHYAVTSRKQVVPGFKRIAENHPEVEKIIFESLKHDTTQTWTFWHTRIMPDNIVYTISTSDNASFITEYSNGKLAVLKDVYEDQFYTHLFPLPLYDNGKPLILISEAVRDSDHMWDYLARYNGQEYEGVSYNRIK